MVDDLTQYIAELKDERNEAREDYQRMIKVAEHYKQALERLKFSLSHGVLDRNILLKFIDMKLKGAEPNDDQS